MRDPYDIGVFYISPEAFDAMLEELDKPAEVDPRLLALFRNNDLLKDRA